MSVIHINKENFTSVISGSKPVLLDFWAPWCGPCRMVAPIVEAIANDRDDIIVGKINVDEEMELAVRFKIVSIPTLIVMKDGKEAAKTIGYCPREEIEALLSR
jgi:thioredoxin 1